MLHSPHYFIKGYKKMLLPPNDICRNIHASVRKRLKSFIQRGFKRKLLGLFINVFFMNDFPLAK